jgi:hypothetical protein
MTRVLKLISFLGLALTVVPALLVFTGSMSWGTHAALTLLGAVLWFGSAPFWMGEGANSAASRGRS